MVWTGNKLELVEFLNYINELYQLSSLGTGLERINYLDVQVHKADG